MFDIFLGALFAVCAVVCWVMLKTYQHVPAKELKRWARRGDDVARLLYRAVAYGMSLNVLLGGAAIVFGALSLVEFESATNVWWAVLIVLVTLGFGGFLFVPSERLTRGSLWLAERAVPLIAWLLERLSPVIDWFVRQSQRYRHVHVHTGLYEKDDLYELLERQKHQADSRIPKSEIDLLQHALTFGEKLVSDALIPQRVVNKVKAGEAVGPVLMDELSRSGHSRFPVYEGSEDNIVGILYLHDLVGIREGGKVSDVMSRQLTYIHEDFTLYQALQAFLKTKRHLFLVVNSFEELVGILTIEDVLEQMIGKPIMDEFDKYDDLRAVAAVEGLKEHGEHVKDKTEPDAPVESAEQA